MWDKHTLPGVRSEGDQEIAFSNRCKKWDNGGAQLKGLLRGWREFKCEVFNVLP